MENKADVKAITARFQANAATTEESSLPSLGRPKAPLNLTLSSGPIILSKKPVLESLSGGAITIPPKPSHLKNTAPNVPQKTKALASRFDGSQDESSNKTTFLDRGHTPLKTPPTPKPTLKPPLSTTLSNSKPAFPKPPPAASKPSSGDSSPKIPPLTQKPSSSVIKLWQQSEAHVDKCPAELVKPVMHNKPPAGHGDPPPKPPVSKKPSLRKPAIEASQNGAANDDTASGPKRKPLPNSLILGPAPAKPNRPPKVNLDDFRRAAGVFTGSTSNKNLSPASSAPGSHSNCTTQPPKSALPSLPPRPFGSITHQEESYDDVEGVKTTTPSPPPLPPSTAHPSQRAKEEHHHDHDDDDSGDTYEPLDEPWEEEEKKREEEKRQQEVEKKEQKGREKKEQEARKKFKLVGPLEAIHQGKACVDCRGSRTDLPLKQGECLDIVRVHGNPEGKWLGRKQDGSIGYVKTTSVEIDFNTLKRHQAQQGSKCDVYDDVDVASSDSSGISGHGVLLPPPPDEDGEIYNDVMDPDLDVRLPPPSQFTAADHSAVDDEIYYDVDAQNQPPPPPISSIPVLKVKESDPKKMKKFEKEEKDFRKKFKYEGEIRVLYGATVTTPTALLNKKWGGKELAVKAGEKVDVIVKAADDKILCRNEEGKFGYVCAGHVATDDGDIYDDVGDDWIYDNE